MTHKTDGPRTGARQPAVLRRTLDDDGKPTSIGPVSDTLVKTPTPSVHVAGIEPSTLISRSAFGSTRTHQGFPNPLRMPLAPSGARQALANTVTQTGHLQ
jgi:hypothetical protein